jgi:diacylglycerol kinase family enzyme
MKHIFIVNPAAGKRDHTVESSRFIQELCKKMELDYAVYRTARPGHATELVRQIAGAEPGEHFRFYACGGDGTLNEVVNGVSKVTNAAFTHYPLGTGNDFIKVFGSDAEKFRDLEALIRGEEIEMDYIESPELDAINIVSVGIDARVADDMSKYRKVGSGIVPYVFSTVENVIKGIVEDLEVLVDGFDDETGRFYGRSLLEAPESDGCIWLNAKRELIPGEYVQVRITGADAYDLEGTIIE